MRASTPVERLRTYRHLVAIGQVDDVRAAVRAALVPVHASRADYEARQAQRLERALVQARRIPRALKAEVLASGPCVYCGAPSTVVDHVIPVVQGGTRRRGNLAPACEPCNASKGGLTPGQWKVRQCARSLAWQPTAPPPRPWRPPRAYIRRDREPNAEVLTSRARRVVSLGMTRVPGLLQADAYMRAVVTGGGQLEGNRLEAWVAARSWRRRLLAEPGREFVQIVSGPALLWAAGNAEVMRDQLDHLAVASRLPAVHLGVIPPCRPVDVFPLHNMDLYERANGDRAVIVGTLGGTAVLDDPFDLDRHAAMLGRLGELASWGDEARTEIERIADLYRDRE